MPSKSNPAISVIVPIYNAEKWLNRCVDSILAQVFTDFELLLIDDGSTDGSGTICDMYRCLGERIRVFHKPNGGVSSARNLGIKEALGEYISFVDADDTVSTDLLGNLFSKMKEGADLSISSFKTNDIESKYFLLNDQIIESKEEAVSLILPNAICGPLGKLYKTDIIRSHNLRFHEDISIGEDCIFNAEYMIHCNKIITSKNFDYIYNTTNQDSATKKICKVEVLVNFFNCLNECLNRFSFSSEYTIHYVIDTHFKVWFFNILHVKKDGVKRMNTFLNSTSIKRIFDSSLIPQTRPWKIKYRLLYNNHVVLCKIYSTIHEFARKRTHK